MQEAKNEFSGPVLLKAREGWLAVKTREEVTAAEKSGGAEGVTLLYFFNAACHRCPAARLVIENTLKDLNDRIFLLSINTFDEDTLDLVYFFVVRTVPHVVVMRPGKETVHCVGNTGEDLESVLKSAVSDPISSEGANLFKTDEDF